MKLVGMGQGAAGGGGCAMGLTEFAWEVGFEMGWVISSVMTTRADLEQGAMRANPLALNTQRGGTRP